MSAPSRLIDTLRARFAAMSDSECESFWTRMTRSLDSDPPRFVDGPHDKACAILTNPERGVCDCCPCNGCDGNGDGQHRLDCEDVTVTQPCGCEESAALRADIQECRDLIGMHGWVHSNHASGSLLWAVREVLEKAAEYRDLSATQREQLDALHAAATKARDAIRTAQAQRGAPPMSGLSIALRELERALGGGE